MKNLVMLVTLGILAIGANGETNSTANGTAPRRSEKRMFPNLPRRTVNATNENVRTPSLEEAQQLNAIKCELRRVRERKVQEQLGQDIPDAKQASRRPRANAASGTNTITRADVIRRLKDLVGEELAQQPSTSSNKLVLVKPIGEFKSGFAILGGGKIRSMRFTYEPPKGLSDAESEKIANESCAKFVAELGLEGRVEFPMKSRGVLSRRKTFEGISFSMNEVRNDQKRVFTFAISDIALGRQLAARQEQVRQKAWLDFVCAVQKSLKPMSDEDREQRKGWVDAELQEPFFKFSKVRLGYVHNEIAVVLFCFKDADANWTRGKGAIFERFNLTENYARRMYFNCSHDTRNGEPGAVAISNYSYDRYGLISD